MNTAQVIPFQFDTREVRTLLIDDQPWFVAMDVAVALQYTDAQAMTRKLDGDEVQNRQIVGFGNRGVAIINESGLYSAILRSRKAEAKRFKKWVTAEVLPAIRRHGHYQDDENKLGTLIGQTIGTDGFHMLGALISGKVRALPAATQRRAKMKLWRQVHTAFNVQRGEDIPADQLDAARNFVAAYSIEGDWLPAPEPRPAKAGINLTDEQAHNMWVAFFHFAAVQEVYRRHSLYDHLTGLGSRAAIEMNDHLNEGVMLARFLTKRLEDDLKAVRHRLRIPERHSVLV